MRDREGGREGERDSQHPVKILNICHNTCVYVHMCVCMRACACMCACVRVRVTRQTRRQVACGSGDAILLLTLLCKLRNVYVEGGVVGGGGIERAREIERVR